VHWSGKPGLIAVALLFASCQTDGSRPTVSLEEAKKVAANFTGQSQFVPPPRSINDITEILDQHKPDPTIIRALSAAADAKPPEGADANELADFFFERSLAAYELNRVKQQLKDMREAVRYRSEAGRDIEDIRLKFMIAELSAGNSRNALRLADEHLNGPEFERRIGRSASISAMAAMVSLRLGDVEGGKRRLRDAEALLVRPRFMRWKGYHTASRHYRSNLTRINARFEEEIGNYAEAERGYRAGLSDVRWLDRNFDLIRNVMPALPPNIYKVKQWVGRLDLVRILRKQGRLVESEAEARRALLNVLKTYGRYSSRAASSVSTLASTIHEQGRTVEALKLTHAALDIYQQLGAGLGSLSVARLHTVRARILQQQGDIEGALAGWMTARSLFSGDARDRYRFVESLVDYSRALLQSGRLAEALTAIKKVVANRRGKLGDKHYETAGARGFLAMTLMRAGKSDRALAEFRAAVPLLLQTSRRTNGTEGGGESDRRRRVIFEAYIDLLSGVDPGRIAGFDPVSEAFRVADAARAGNVQRALAASAARGAVRDPDLARLARQEQDAQKQIAARFGLLSNILSGPADQQDPGATDALRKGIDRLRAARATLREEIERRFPDYAALIDPRPMAMAEARDILKPGEALIATFVGKTRSFVWTLPAEGKVAFAAVPLGGERIAAVVRKLRRALDPKAATLGAIPKFDVALSHRLYQALLAPVAAGWKDADSLLIVAHGALGQLPFSVLVTSPTRLDKPKNLLFSNYRGVPWLARSHAVTVLPSVASLTILRHLPPPSPNRRNFVGFGDPWFSKTQAAEATSETKPRRIARLTSRGLLAVRGVPLKLRAAPRLEGVASANIARLPRLPDTADEVRGIARALRADVARDVFTGARASEDRVRAMNLSGYRVLAFATHGLVPGDLDGLRQPALALSSPAVVGGQGDGLLTMGEILGLRLDADWVVLSACNTASGDGKGAEAVSGLGRAFFYAGTRALLVSNWPVETTSARALTTDLFRRQAKNLNLTRARALRQTMLGMIDGDGLRDGNGRTVFAYAHPIFWAPFPLVGDSGGGASGT